ncbi:cell division control protein 4 [Pisolithus orientalis]|uniref:cell division control protein 4 n=1 Tax=Pisolithus orientalis TaxID=936130 RepID=UPI00222496AB|nr:cell division control protein 4 [Pisolithus orientalis]KAI6008715.1 cell division control protein 4 [Pisolithus orientalis]
MAPNEHPKHLSIPAHGTSVVTCLLLSHGRIVSASDDHSIHVYSPATSELLQSLRGHEGGVWTLAASRDILVSHTSTVRCLAIVRPEVIDVEGEGGVITREKWLKQSLSGADDTDAELTEDVNENPYHKSHLEGHDHAVRALAARGRMPIPGSFDWECKWVLAGRTQKCVVLDIRRIIACSGSMGCACQQMLTGHASLVGLLGLSPPFDFRRCRLHVADLGSRYWRAPLSLEAHSGAMSCFQHVFEVLSGSDGTLKMNLAKDLLTDDDWDSESPGGIYDDETSEEDEWTRWARVCKRFKEFRCYRQRRSLPWTFSHRMSPWC